MTDSANHDSEDELLANVRANIARDLEARKNVTQLNVSRPGPSPREMLDQRLLEADSILGSSPESVGELWLW